MLRVFPSPGDWRQRQLAFKSPWICLTVHSSRLEWVSALAHPPEVVTEEIGSLTPDQVQTFLTGIRGDRHEALYVLAVATGVRQGEVLGLRWEDVDLAAGQLVVRHALQRITERRGSWSRGPRGRGERSADPRARMDALLGRGR